MLFVDPFPNLCTQIVSLHSTHINRLFLIINLINQSSRLFVQSVVRVFCRKLTKASFELFIKLSVNLIDSPNHFFPGLNQVVQHIGQVSNFIYLSAVSVLGRAEETVNIRAVEGGIALWVGA